VIRVCIAHILSIIEELAVSYMEHVSFLWPKTNPATVSM